MTTPAASITPDNLVTLPTIYGVPTDAMFSSTPADGSLVYRADGSAGNWVYVRVAGVWQPA